eukprot:gene18159-21717_t
MNITNKKLYYINSKSRPKTSTSTSHFTFTLDDDSQNNHDRVVVLQAIIPKSFYTVRRNLNTFTLVETTDTSSIDTTITIPFGNYSRSVQWPTSKQPNLGKFTFTCSGGGEDMISFVFGNSLFRHLGFNHDSTNEFQKDPITGFMTLQSTNVINLQSDNVLYIRSNICTNGSDDVLQEIYSASGSPDYSNIHWINPDPESYCKKLTSNKQNSFTLYLTDQDGNVVNLNGVDLNITLISATINTGGNTTIFNLAPNNVYNLSRSWIQFSVTIPAGGNNLKPYVYADFIPYFQQITFGNGSQLQVANIIQAHLQSKMIMKINRKQSKTMSRFASTTIANGGDTHLYTPCYPSNKLPATNLRYDGTPADRAYTEPAYMLSGTTLNQPTTLHVRLYLCDIFDSVFAVDKDLCFSENMYITLTWNQASNIGFYAAADLTVPAAIPTMTANNLELHLANETVQDIIIQIRERVESASGLSLMVPYTYPFNKQTNGSTQSSQVRVNANNGLTLDRIYYSTFTPNNAGAPNLSVYNNSVATTNLDYFQTSLDNSPLTFYNIYPKKYNDYDMNQKLLEGSTIQTPDINNANWVWVQDFGQGFSSEISDNVYKGIPLSSNDTLFEFNCNLVAGQAGNLFTPGSRSYQETSVDYQWQQRSTNVEPTIGVARLTS